MATKANSMSGEAAEAKAAADFLRANVPLRNAVQMGKRVEYFRGKKLVECLMESTAKGKPECPTRQEAARIGMMLLRYGYTHASEVVDKRRRMLQPIKSLRFDPEGYYTWIYQGSQKKNRLLLALIIIGFLCCVMFPAWPRPVKVGVWYVSVTFLLALLGTIVLRLVVWFLLWLLGFDCWILPNMFDEEIPFWDTVKPIVSFERSAGGQWLYRVAALALSVATCYWVWQQPTEFDDFVSAQQSFVTDLYEGTLLSDKSEEDKQNIDKVIPDLDDILKDTDEAAGERADNLQPEDFEDKADASFGDASFDAAEDAELDALVDAALEDGDAGAAEAEAAGLAEGAEGEDEGEGEDEEEEELEPWEKAQRAADAAKQEL